MDHGADEVTKEVNVREGVVEVELYGVIELVVDTGQPKIWWNIPKKWWSLGFRDFHFLDLGLGGVLGYWRVSVEYRYFKVFFIGLATLLMDLQ